jgi:hypothetical protein
VELDADELLPGLSSSARLEIEYDIGTQSTAPVGRIAYARTLAALDLCPQAWSAAWLTVRPCVHGAAGALRPRALDIPTAGRVDGAWAEAGVSASVRASLVLGVFAELDGRLLFPITRDRYYFQPSTSVGEVSAVAASFGISVGVRFR